MNIHSYEKLWLIGAMVLIVAFIATVSYGAVGLGIAMIDDSEDTIDPNALDEDERFSDLGVHQVGEDEYEVNIEAYQFNFNPGTEGVHEPIVLPEGSDVTFYVTSSDVIHSFSLAGTNVNTMVVPGEVSTMTATFDDVDEYGVVCNEYCGSGHHGMEGLVQIVPEDEFHLLSFESVDAPEEIGVEEDFEVTATVANDALEEETTAVELEVANETLEESVTIDGESTETVTFTVDAEALEAGEDYDWTVTMEEETADGTVSVESSDDEADNGGDD